MELPYKENFSILSMILKECKKELKPLWRKESLITMIYDDQSLDYLVKVNLKKSLKYICSSIISEIFG
jgi:hypothetical protein